MKKLLCSIVALLGFTAVNAATVDDLKQCQHSKIFVMDNYTGNGTGSRTKAGLAFSGYFWDVTGGSVTNKKGSIDLSNQATLEGYEFVGCESSVAATLVAKYGKYGSHLNSLRIKNKQDVFALKVTAGSKVYFLGKSGGSGVRYPKIASDADMSNVLTKAAATTAGPWVYCYEATDDQTIYVGSEGGDTFLSYVIIEANEPAGTPTVEVGDMQYDSEKGLYYIEVTCTPNNYVIDGVDLGETYCTYTTDGIDPNENSARYSEPIRCYQDCTVKFQACQDGAVIDGATNEGAVEFTFNAPTLTTDGANFTITTDYNNATNYYTVNGGEETAGDSGTLETSGTVTAYTKIVNGNYATFTTPTATSEVYVLEPIKSDQTVVFSGDAVEDADATAASTDGSTVYKVENGTMTATNPECFYLKSTSEYGAVTNEAYQVDGEDAYLKMTGNSFLSFKIAAGDSALVIVTCSKNSAKSLEDGGDKTCAVNLSGTSYSNADVTADGGNVITFDITKQDADQVYTFQKYSGTGNIFIHQIQILFNKSTGIKGVTVDAVEDADAPAYNVAGQRVSKTYKGIVVKNGKKYIVK